MTGCVAIVDLRGKRIQARNFAANESVMAIDDLFDNVAQRSRRPLRLIGWLAIPFCLGKHSRHRVDRESGAFAGRAERTLAAAAVINSHGLEDANARWRLRGNFTD